MKVYKVYNATTNSWLDLSQRTFYQPISVYGTGFASQEDAQAAIERTEASWLGHKIEVVPFEIPASPDEWTQEDEEANQAEHDYQCHIDELEDELNRRLDGEEREREEAEDYDPYRAICESRFGLPGNVSG